MFTFQDVFTEHSYTKTTSRNQILTMLTIINKNARNHQSKEYQSLQKHTYFVLCTALWWFVCSNEPKRNANNIHHQCPFLDFRE